MNTAQNVIERGALLYAKVVVWNFSILPFYNWQFNREKKLIIRRILAEWSILFHLTVYASADSSSLVFAIVILGHPRPTSE